MTTWWLVEYQQFFDRVVAGGHQGAVHDEHGVFAEPLAGRILLTARGRS